MQTKTPEPIRPPGAAGSGPITAPPRLAACLISPVLKWRPRPRPEVEHGA